MVPNCGHIPAAANHIAKYLSTPYIVFVQKIQDNSGPTPEDDVASAKLALTTQVSAAQKEGGRLYGYIDTVPSVESNLGKPFGAYSSTVSRSPSALVSYRADKVKYRRCISRPNQRPQKWEKLADVHVPWLTSSNKAPMLVRFIYSGSD